MGSAQSKKVRQQRLEAALIKNPFLTDAHLAEQFEVSIQTIRLDRLALGIPELRERDAPYGGKMPRRSSRRLPVKTLWVNSLTLKLGDGFHDDRQ